MTETQRRKPSNVRLTKQFHWPYVGGWLVLNILQTIFIEFVFLLILSNLEPTGIDVQKYAYITAGMSIIFMIGLCVLGVFWAHRIAGVHLRTERAFREVAEGKDNVRLKFRASDQLEELEQAFNVMMASYENGFPEIPEGVEPEETLEPDSGNRRDWRNMQMTWKYHFSYMAPWVVLSIGQLIVVYGVGLLSLHLFTYSGTNSPGISLNAATIIATALALGLGFLIIWNSMKSAHRMAGVHVKLAKILTKVGSGAKDVKLKFRAYDKLQNLEEAFLAMMERLHKT